MANTMEIDAWMDTCLVTIHKFATTDLSIEAHAMTETIDIAEPDYPGESIPNLAGGRVWKQSPQEDGEITLEIYPIQLDTTSDNLGLFEQFTGGTPTGSEPRATDTSWTAGVDRTRDKFAVSILWTTDNAAGTEPTKATNATAASTDSLRFVALGCRMISHKADFTDGLLKVTATFKFPAMSQAGDVKMCRWESGDQTALTAVFATSTNKYNDLDSYAGSA